MKALRYVLLATLVGVTNFVCAAQKPWTFLVYIAGDNDLAEFAYKDLDEMMQVGSNQNVNVLVYLNSRIPGGDKFSSRVVVHKGRLEFLDDNMSKDSGDVYTLVEALEWAHNDYPSEHLAVVLWNHGSGPLNRRSGLFRGICYDDTTGNYLTDRDCFNALGWLCDQMPDGKKVDILACDACLMGCVELAYTMQPFANYFVASQETIPGDGYQYTYILEQFEDGAPNPRDLAESMVDVYADTYKKDDEYTLSAIDLDEIDQVVGRLNILAQHLTQELKGPRRKRVKKYLKRTIKNRLCLHFGGEPYIDLYQWLNNVLKYLPRMKLGTAKRDYLEDLIWDTMRCIHRSVIENVFSMPCREATGMSIYFPHDYIDSSYHDILWSEWTDWLQFLQAYLDA